jgi:hypothetical protein
MRIWVNFRNSNGWTVNSLAEDGTTVIGPDIRVAKESTLLGLLRLSGADEKTLFNVSQDMRTGGGTVAIDVNEKGRKLLQIGTL